MIAFLIYHPLSYLTTLGSHSPTTILLAVLAMTSLFYGNEETFKINAWISKYWKVDNSTPGIGSFDGGWGPQKNGTHHVGPQWLVGLHTVGQFYN